MDSKPGYLTTEFWVTVLTGILGLVTLFIPNVDSDRFGAIVQAAALLMVGLTTAFYSHSRSKVKSSAGVALPLIETGDVNIKSSDTGQVSLLFVVCLATLVGVVLLLFGVGADIHN